MSSTAGGSRLAASDRVLTEKRTQNPYLFLYNALLFVAWCATLRSSFPDLFL